MKVNILAGIITIMLMNTYLQAETITKEPVCKTILECDKLTEHFRAEIDGLKVKDSLTKDEKKLKYTLRKELLAAQDAIILIQKAKQIEIRKTNKKLDELSGMVK